MSDRKRNWSMSDWNYKRKREFKEGMYKTRERFMKLMSPEPIQRLTFTDFHSYVQQIQGTQTPKSMIKTQVFQQRLQNSRKKLPSLL
ncbi:hypothetical protein pb186bvf_006064 [Paramecium bursaria]